MIHPTSFFVHPTTYARIRIVVILSIGWYASLCAQPRLADIRFDVGRSFIGENFPNGQVYDLWLFTLGSSIKRFGLGQHVHINGLLEVHFGAASTSTSRRRDFDAALNISGELVWQFHPSIGFRLAIGTGPGYQSSETNVQAKGFVFSNNLSTGLSFALAQESLIIVPQVRFRHMSNASLNSPNNGIDNFLFLVGVAVPIIR